VLVGWVVGQTAIQSFRSLSATHGRGRLLMASVWGGFIGLLFALLFGVTLPEVMVWLWLAIGLLLAPAAHEIRVHKAIPTIAAVLESSWPRGRAPGSSPTHTSGTR